MDIKLNKLLIKLNESSIRLVYMNDDFKYIVTVFWNIKEVLELLWKYQIQ